MNEEDGVVVVLKPCSSEPPSSEPTETVDPRTGELCDTISVGKNSEIPDESSSLDAVEDEGVGREDCVCRTVELPPAAEFDGGTIQEVEAQVELTAEDGGVELESGVSLPSEEKYDKGGEGRMEMEDELSVVAEKQGELVEAGEIMVKVEENDSLENVNVEEAAPVSKEGGKYMERGDHKVMDEKIHSGENVNVQEVPPVPGESGKSVGECESLSDVKLKELNGGEGTHGRTENDGELGGNQVTEGVMKQEDELNGEEPMQVNRNEEMSREEHTDVILEVKIKEVNGGEETHILNEKDAAFRGKHENQGVMKHKDEFNGEEETLQVNGNGEMDREEQIDVLLEVKIKELNGEEETHRLNENDGQLRGNHKTDGVMQQEDESNGEEEPLQVNGDEEMAEEEQIDAIESPSVCEEDEEMAGEELPQEIVDSLLNGDATKGNELIGEDGNEGTGTQMEMDMEGEAEVETTRSGNSGKRKRGKNSKAPLKVSRNLVGEDVCFICLDGGDLVLCDRRGCPKAYHPSCVDRDEAFFRAKGRWNCGWHLCSKCGKNAYYMCYTCTFSLCKGCIKDAVIYCIRGSGGLCETCMKIVMLIETNERGNNDMVAFDDKSQWEYLFKDYWIEQKEKLSITSEELAQAKNPWEGCDADDKQETPAEIHESEIGAGNGSDSFLNAVGATSSKRKKNKKRSKSLATEKDSDTDSSTGKADVSKTKGKAKRQMKPQTKGANSDSDNSTGQQGKAFSRRKKARKLSKSHGNVGDLASQTAASGDGVGAQGSTEWASKELLELVMHMKNGDRSVLSHFEVQKLLLDYITMNNLRDPRLRSQIICDSMLQKLFGKPRVAHFEMLKLLESHFLVNEDSQADDNQGSVVDTEVSQLDVDENTDSLMSSRFKGRKARKKGDERGLQSNLDDYASIDMHNINLIYLRRNLIEALLEDLESFHDKVVGSFVRIRISGSGQKQDIYRLVQVVGTSKAAEQYTVGKRTTDIMLEILNLDKTETVSSDTISNQEFTEDECQRLRQSIKCGLISRLTVGGVLQKAKELHEVRVTDWLQAEITRLRHLCDRASDLGRKRELRECVEKLELLKTPEERQRRLDEIPEVHADPNMDPSYESEDDNEIDNRRPERNMRWREIVSFRSKDQFSSQKGGSTLNDSWSETTKLTSRKWGTSRSVTDKGYSGRREYASAVEELSDRNAWQQGVDKGTSQFYSWEKSRTTSDPIPSKQAEYAEVITNVSPPAESENLQPVSTAVAPADTTANKTQKVWHYRDPSGKVQGPFSMVQLRKWSKTGFFPADLKIWRTTQSGEDSILLTEALAGRFQKEPPLVGGDSSEAQGVLTPQLLPSNTVKGYGSLNGNRGQGTKMLRGDQICVAGTAGSSVVSSLQSQLEMGISRADMTSKGWVAPSSVETPKFSASGHGPDLGGKYDLSNLPSPTPAQNAAGWTVKRNHRSRWSDASVSLQSSSSAMETRSNRANIVLSSPNLASSDNHVFMKSNPPSSEPNPGMDRVHLSQQSSKEANIPRNREDNLPSAGQVLLGSGFSVAPPSINGLHISLQSNVPGESPRVQASTHPLLPPPPPPNTATPLMNAGQGVSNVAASGAVQVQASTHMLPSPPPPLPPNTATASMNVGQGVSNVASSVAVQNPSVYGWGTGFVARPEIMNPSQIPGNGQAWGVPGLQNNPNAMSVQQPANGYWANAPVSGVPQSYGASQFAGPGNFAAPNFAGMAFPNQWRPPITPAPTNMPWGMVTPDNPGVAPTTNTAWCPVTANPNVGFGGAPPGAAVGPAPGPSASTAAFEPPPGAAKGHLPVGPAVAPGLPPGSTNTSWPSTGIANSASTDGPSTWGSEQNPNGGGSHRNRQPFFGRGVCRFHENGHCKKGASCDFLHN